MGLSVIRPYTWVVGLILLVLGVLGYQDILGFLSSAAFWLETGGLALLLIAGLVKKL